MDRKHAFPLLWLFLAWLVYAGGLLSTQTTLYLTDTFAQDVPLRVHSASAIRDGNFPAWTPLLHCGYPIYSDGQTGICYPLFLLYILDPTPEMHDRFMALHYGLAGLFSYLFLTRRVGSPFAAAAGAITFMASASLQSTHVVPGILATACWLPLALYLIDRHADNDTRSIYLCTLVNTTAIFAGVVQLALYSFTLQAAYMLFRFRPKRWKDLLFAAAFAFFVPAILSAVQTVPTYVMSADSTRLNNSTSALDWESFTMGSLDPRHLWTFFHPDWFGEPKHYSLPGDPFDTWEESLQVFCGFAAILLAPIGALFGKPRSESRFWVAVVVIALLFAMATPLYTLLYYIPPYNWFRWPSRFMPMAAMAIATLTALGTATIVPFLVRGCRTTWASSLIHVGIALAVLLGMYRTMNYYTTSADFWTIHPESLLEDAKLSSHVRLLPLARALYDCWNVDELRSRRNAAFLPVSYNLLWNVPAAALFDQGHAVTPKGVDEVLTLPHPNALRIAAITHVSSPVPPERLSPVEQLAYRVPIPNSINFDRLSETDPFLARFKTSRPRAWMVHNAIFLPNPTERLTTIASDEFRPSNTAIVEEEIRLDPNPVRPSSVSIQTDNPDHLQIDVDASATGLLVLADSFHGGWSALLDGRPVRILRVNHAFRGIVVPRGRHHVAFYYRTPGLVAGAAISLIGLDILIAAALITSKQQRLRYPYSESRST